MKINWKSLLLCLCGGALIALGLITSKPAVSIVSAIAGIHLIIWSYLNWKKE